LVSLLGLAAIVSFHDAGAQPVTVNAELAPSADTYVRSIARNRNEGASPFLAIPGLGQHRALVAFDSAEMAGAGGGAALVSATLHLEIVEIFGFWGAGHNIDLHRVTTAWAEGNGYVLGAPQPNVGSGSGATFNCAVDANIANIFANCSGPTEWDMGIIGTNPWVSPPTSSVFVEGDASGTLSFDVTADVAAFLTGAAENHGWLLKRANDAFGGSIVFGSRENGGSEPVLELVFEAAEPEANDDAYDATGNIAIDVPAPGLFANDTLNGATLDAFDATSSAGGEVNVNPDGSFSYNPPPGFEGGDSFSYTIANMAGSSTGTVDLTVADMIWFVDNAAPADGDGRIGSPFNALESFNANAADDPGDVIFLYTGAGDYSGGVTLLDEQWLVGQGVELGATTGIVPAEHSSLALPGAGGSPVLTNAAGDGVSLALNNNLHGFDVGDTAGAGLSGSGFGTLTIGTLSVSGGGTVAELESGVLAAALDAASSSGGVDGLTLREVSGSLSIGGGTISGAADNAVLIQNLTTNEALSVTFADMTLSGAGGDGLFIFTAGNASVTVALSGANLADNETDGVQVLASGSSAVGLSVTGSTVTGSHVAVDVASDEQASVSYLIDGNPLLESDGATVVNVHSADESTSSGTISNNPAISESPTGNGVWVVQEGDGAAVVLIDNNAISGVDFGNGIALHARDGGGSLDATVSNNTIDADAGGFSAHGIAVMSGNGQPGESSAVCVNYQGNDSEGGPGFAAYFLEQFTGTSFQIQGLTPAAGATEAEVEAFVTAANAVGAADVSPADGVIVVVDYQAGTCATP
jgi:hypothetical protein